MSKLSSLTAAQFKRAAEIKEQIETLSGQLTAILEGGLAPTDKTEPVQSLKKSKFSPAGLARLRAAQKARWAKLKSSETDSSVTPEKKTRRKRSNANRTKMAAAQKARWAKVHVEKVD